MSEKRKREFSQIVGVIFRGSFWLDGVFTFTAKRSDERYVEKLASTIKGTKQYSQLHAAIFSRQNMLAHGLQDFKLLAEEMDLPILVLLKKTSNRQSQRMIWSPNEKPSAINELFTISCAKGTIVPEAVRVAELIANQL